MILFDNVCAYYTACYIVVDYINYKKLKIRSIFLPLKYLGDDDIVKCFCCGVEYGDWKEDFIPMQVHVKDFTQQ